MSQHFHRALMLFEQSRYDMAEQELRQELLAEPNDPRPHALLALCLTERKKYEEATSEARTAIGYGPDLPFTHYALAQVYRARNRPDEARNAIAEAIRLDPEDADHFALLAAIEMQRRDWRAALQAADKGLAIDPEHTQSAGLRAMALVQLGRKDEAHATIDGTLSRAPEDDLAHANKGWALLHQGRPREAMDSFREALRIDPENEWARQGMVQALKARHLFYRVLLAYFLWMSRLSHKAQWGVIIGIYFLPRMLRSVAEHNPALRIVIYPVVGLLALFVLMTWIADPLFNLVLRLSRFGRLVLSRDQVMASNVLLGCIAGAIVCLVLALSWDGRAFYPMFVFLLMTIPVSGTFAAQPGWPKIVLAIYTVVLTLLAFGGMLLAWAAGPDDVEPQHTLAMLCIGAWVIGLFVFSLAANGLAMVRVRE